MGVQSFGNMSLAGVLPYSPRADRAMCIDSNGQIRARPGLLSELDPADLNRSVTPTPASGIYDYGTIGMYRDSHFLVARWSPEKATAAATERLIDVLRWLLPGHAILLCYDVGGWCVERYFSPELAVTRIRELTAARNSTPISTTHVERVSIDLSRSGPPFLSLAWSLWHQMMEQNDRDMAHPFWSLARSHAVWIDADDDSDAMSMSYVGPKAPMRRHYRDSWFQECFTRRQNWASTNNRHEQRVAMEYTEVADTGCPRLDNIVGNIDLESGQTVWLQYKRLILPVPVTSNIPAVYVFSELQPNLPFPLFNDRARLLARG